MTTMAWREEHDADAWLRAAIGYATLAPSRHNAQPWRFRVADGAAELLADRGRRLPAADANDRELAIGCGAALAQLRLALRHFGRTDVVETLPDPARPDLLARVRPGAPAEPTPEADALFRAIPRRHTNRGPFADRPLGTVLRDALGAAARAEGAALRDVRTSADRVVVASLVAEAARRRAADRAYRGEVADWLRANGSARRDGVPAAAHGLGDAASRVAPFVVRRVGWGGGRTARDGRLALRAPALLVLHTDGDDPAAWLCAGQALARVLLTATAMGLAASFLGEVIEIPSLRADLARVLGIGGAPQVLLRVGFAPPGPATPRRAVGEVVDAEPRGPGA